MYTTKPEFKFLIPCAVEYPVELGNLPATIGRMVGMKNRKYGRTMLAVYCVRPGMDLEPRPDEFESTGLKYEK